MTLPVNSVFWKTTQLADMTSAEWESLCDGCGKCCLHKLEDESDGEVYYTDIACQYLDAKTCRCIDYSQREILVAECLTLGPQQIAEFHWLPATCAYRLISEGKELPLWHPLMSGDKESVHQAGQSVKGRVVAETDVDLYDYEDHVITWVV
jgi:uncharacterized cysteine cluster protein YcgN (CxxCxxCC family)